MNEARGWIWKAVSSPTPAVMNVLTKRLCAGRCEARWSKRRHLLRRRVPSGREMTSARREGCTCGTGRGPWRWGGGAGVRGDSALSVQFFCDPKTALEIKSQKKKKMPPSKTSGNLRSRIAAMEGTRRPSRGRPGDPFSPAGAAVAVETRCWDGGSRERGAACVREARPPPEGSRRDTSRGWGAARPAADPAHALDFHGGENSAAAPRPPAGLLCPLHFVAVADFAAESTSQGQLAR